MTGRYLVPFRKKLFFPFYSRLPLSTANAATFPDKRGQLFVWVISLFFGFTHTIFVLSFLLTLAPSDGFAATLAKAKRLTHFYSVAPLLEKWFACFPCPGMAYDLHFIVLWQ